MVSIFNFDIRQGETITKSFTLREIVEIDGNKQEQPKDISGYLGRGWVVLRVIDQTPLCKLRVNMTTPAEGRYTVTVPATESEKLPIRGATFADINEFQYDVEFYNPLNPDDVIRVLHGKVFVSPECTKMREDITHTVTFNSLGGSEIEDQEIANGGLVEYVEPERESFVFEGWYYDEALTQIWDFDETKVYGDITLYASWTAA